MIYKLFKFEELKPFDVVDNGMPFPLKKDSVIMYKNMHDGTTKKLKVLTVRDYFQSVTFKENGNHVYPGDIGNNKDPFTWNTGEAVVTEID